MNNSQETIIYQVKKIDFIFSNYLNFPKSERAYFYIELLDNPITINKLTKKYKNFLYGFSVVIKDFENKQIRGEETILITSKTQVCFFYMEYRILLFFDLSLSMYNYDTQKQLYIEKIEIYMKFFLESLIKFEKKIYNLKYELMNFKPKMILGIACSPSEDDLKMILHEIILESSNFDYYLKLLIKKLHFIIKSFNNTRKINPILPSNLNENFNNSSMNNYKVLDLYIEKQCKYLNSILEYSLYYLDLLPRIASPLLFLLTDSNLYFSYFGKYNNILMQFGRIDISIQIFDLFNANEYNPPSSMNSISLKDIAKFTYGNYFPIDYLNDFFKISKTETNKNLLSYNKEGINDYYTTNKNEVSINCKCCKDNISMFFCKKPFHINNNNNFFINENLNENIRLINFNINAINFFHENKITINKKEILQSYELNVPFYLISQARVRESFYYKKSKKQKKFCHKFKIEIFSDVYIIYRITPKDDFNENINEKYTIEIIVKSTFSKFNELKIEHLKNSNVLRNNSFLTRIKILKNFVEEIICTDKVILYFCNSFSEEQDFQTGKHLFFHKKDLLWNLFQLSIHTWHRFFDVDIIESLVINKINNINEDNITSFLLKDKQFPLSYQNQRNLMEAQIFKFCDEINKELKIGIKLIPKSENNSKKKHINGLMIIKIDWIRDNLMLLYIGFFKCFQSTRNNLREKLINEIQNTTKNSDINIQTEPFHLRLLLTKKINVYQNKEFLTIPYKIKEVKDEQKNEFGSIFTYTVGNKLILSYLIVKVSEPFTFSIDLSKTKFVKFLIFQKLKENFSILNTDINSITLISKLNVLNITNFKDIIPEKIYKNQIALVYTISVFEQDKIKTEIAIEPNHSFYIFKCNEKTINIYDKEKFVDSLIKFFKISESKIFNWIKFYNYIMKSIETNKSIKNPKKINSIFYSSKKKILKKQFESFIKEVKKYLSKFKEDEINNWDDNFKNCLTFIKKIDFNFKSRYSKKHHNNIEYIKRIITSLDEIFTIIQDYSFIADNINYYGKLFSTSTIIFFSFPSKNFLLQNNFDFHENTVFSMNFYYISIDSLKQIDKGFYDELLDKKELSSFQTENISKEVISLLDDYNIQNNYLQVNSNCNELNNIIKDNEIFNLNVDTFLNNLYIYINYIVNIVKRYHDLIYYLLNDRNKIKNILKELYCFNIKYSLIDILKKSEYEFDFIVNKIDEMIKYFFIQMYSNFYVNELPENEENESAFEDFNMTFLNKPSKVKKNAYYFILEIYIEVNDKKYPLEIEKECSFKLFLEKINFKGQEDIILNIYYYFVPDFKDFFLETKENKNERTKIKKNGYSIYYDNKINDEIAKQIPLYFEIEKEEYLFEINQNIKLFMHKISKILFSLKTINEIENLRKEINSTKLTDEELNIKLNKGYSMLSSINKKHFIRQTKSFPIVSNYNLLQNFKLFYIKYIDFYVFDFINDQLEEIKIIKNDCLKMKDSECNSELYKIPFWMKLILINEDKNIRKITIDVKWLYITKEKSIDINNNLKELIFRIIEIKLFEINKRMMIDNLRETNFYNYKIKESEISNDKKEEKNDNKEFEISTDKKSQKDLESLTEEKKDFNFFEENLSNEDFQFSKNINDLENNNKINIESEYNKISDETINSYFKEDIQKYFTSPIDKIFTIEENLNINNIYNFVLSYFEKYYSIENIPNYYKIENKQEKDQIFIISLSLNEFMQTKYYKNNSKNKSKKLFKSFSNNKLTKHLENKNLNNKIKNEKKQILILLYGIVEPSTFIIDKINDIININIKLEKINNYIELFKKKYEIKRLPECEIFLEKTYIKVSNPLEKKYENTQKFDNTINSFIEKTNEAWDKLLKTNEIITALDNELLTTFSDIYDLSNNFEEFKPLKELDKIYINYLISYYMSFDENKVKIFKLNDYKMKIYLTFEDLLHEDYDSDNEKIKDNNLIINTNSIINNNEFAFIISLMNFEDTNYDCEYEIIRRKRKEISEQKIEDIINKDNELEYTIYKLIEQLQFIQTLKIMKNDFEFK